MSNAAAGEAPAIPYAGSTVIALAHEHFETIARTVRLLFGLAHTDAYRALVAPEAGPVTAHEPGNFGVFMGYDFHVTPEGPRLIEVNTNAGGALLNGLHTASLVDPERLGCLCAHLMPVADLERDIVATFEDEHAAARAAAGLAPKRLERVAIVDEVPERQFLAPEFELFRALFARAGIEARIADTRELAPSTGGAGVALDAGRWPVDLVYLRDCDFALASPRARALRDAYLANEVVVTPAPREHFLLADKRRLAVFSSRERLAALGATDDDAGFLAAVVPETTPFEALGAERAWRERRQWVFKPAAAFGSRAVYRGDKLTRAKLAEIAAEPGYVAQRYASPGVVAVDTLEGRRAMKFDVRAYAYRDRVLMLGARIYEGQVTNLRSPGGGFSAICVSRPAADDLTRPAADAATRPARS
ncbi:MAG: hypothetical protein KC560_02770 [Myxococcales bacterium]|nr:hypothetical protein [Myxococcales bacterium]